MLRRSVSNVGLIAGSDVLSRLLGFVVTTYLARELGVDNLGAIGFAMAILSYGLIVTDLGLLKLGTREVARNRAHAQALASGVVALRLMLAFIALAAAQAEADAEAAAKARTRKSTRTKASSESASDDTGPIDNDSNHEDAA